MPARSIAPTWRGVGVASELNVTTVPRLAARPSSDSSASAAWPMRALREQVEARARSGRPPRRAVRAGRFDELDVQEARCRERAAEPGRAGSGRTEDEQDRARAADHPGGRVEAMPAGRPAVRIGVVLRSRRGRDPAPARARIAEPDRRRARPLRLLRLLRLLRFLALLVAIAHGRPRGWTGCGCGRAAGMRRIPRRRIVPETRARRRGGRLPAERRAPRGPSRQPMLDRDRRSLANPAPRSAISAARAPSASGSSTGTATDLGGGAT